MTLHFSHIGFTDALTFMTRLLLAVDDATLLRVIGAYLDDDSVAGEDADVVATHLATYVGKNLGSRVQLDQKGRVGASFQDYAFGSNRVLRRLFRTILARRSWRTRSFTRHVHLQM